MLTNHQPPTISICPRGRHVVLKNSICGGECLFTGSFGACEAANPGRGGGSGGCWGSRGAGGAWCREPGEAGSAGSWEPGGEGCGGCWECGGRVSSGRKHEGGSVIVVHWGSPGWWRVREKQNPTWRASATLGEHLRQGGQVGFRRLLWAYCGRAAMLQGHCLLWRRWRRQ